MNILIIGSGGREHTLSWKVKQSKSCDNLFITPGNAGTAKIGNNVNLDPNNLSLQADFYKIVEEFAGMQYVVDNAVNLVSNDYEDIRKCLI